MAKVLVIRKPDRTIHRVPLANKPRIMSANNKLKQADKWTLEEMDEKEAEKLPYIDNDFVPAAEAQGVIKEKDERIKELEEKLALLNANQPTETAPEKIARINAAETPEAVNIITGDDDRKTVKDAAEKKIASFIK